MTIFDILGPVMVGPSSSHTAGAVRIGLAGRKLLGETVAEAVITLSGSFASTGKGHGTDRALVAGLLGMEPDDLRIPNSFQEAEKMGLKAVFLHADLDGAHPNTAFLQLTANSGKTLQMQAASLGGGRILINQLNGVRIDVTGERPVLIIRNIDQPGYVSRVATAMAAEQVNIATMTLHRDKRGGDAVMVIETDQNIPAAAVERLNEVHGIFKVTCLNL